MGVLEWIICHPELRIARGRFIAVTIEEPYRVLDSDDDLVELLERLGFELTGVYIHQFS